MRAAELVRTTNRAAYVAFGAAVVALAVSVYLTIEHYTASTVAACPESKAINCTKVTTSSWSHIGPVPWALLGLLYYVAMVVVLLPALWQRRDLDRVRLVGACAGVVSVLYLVWVELFRVDAICLWCTVIHVCALIILGSVLWASSEQWS
jgi:uncharacterized membrane protein